MTVLKQGPEPRSPRIVDKAPQDVRAYQEAKARMVETEHRIGRTPSGQKFLEAVKRL